MYNVIVYEPDELETYEDEYLTPEADLKERGEFIESVITDLMCEVDFICKEICRRHDS